MTTDIFKLIFHHDQRLEDLSSPVSPDNPKQMKSSLQDFMKPDPTYSRFYFSGTDLQNERFGLNVLSSYEKLIDAIETAFQGFNLITREAYFSTLNEAIGSLNTGETIILSKDKDLNNIDIADLEIKVNDESGYRKDPLKKAVDAGHIIIYKVQAKDGFDLQMFSRKNVYRDLFYPLQKLVPDHFRFFSINGKKFNTERHFYFETWTLDRPPHGFEEVHPESVL
jgi:hypothetical protein